MHVPPGAGEIGGDHLLGGGAGFEGEAECLGGGAGGEVVVGRAEPSADDQYIAAGSEFTKMACNRFGAIRSAAAFVEIEADAAQSGGDGSGVGVADAPVEQLVADGENRYPNHGSSPKEPCRK